MHVSPHTWLCTQFCSGLCSKIVSLFANPKGEHCIYFRIIPTLHKDECSLTALCAIFSMGRVCKITVVADP